jgi:hypothetical protein
MTEHTDVVFHQVHFLERLQNQAHRHRFAATGAEVMVLGLQQVGAEVGNLLGRLFRRHRGLDDLDRHAYVHVSSSNKGACSLVYP